VAGRVVDAAVERRFCRCGGRIGPGTVRRRAVARESAIETIHRLFGLHLTVRSPDPCIDKGLDALLGIASAALAETQPDCVAAERLHGLPFTPGSRAAILVPATLFLCAIFGRSAAPDIVALYERAVQLVDHGNRPPGKNFLAAQSPARLGGSSPVHRSPGDPTHRCLVGRPPDPAGSLGGRYSLLSGPQRPRPPGHAGSRPANQARYRPSVRDAACRWFVGRIAATVVHLSGRSRPAQQGHLVGPPVLGLPGPNMGNQVTDRRGPRYQIGAPTGPFDPNDAASGLTLPRHARTLPVGLQNQIRSLTKEFAGMQLNWIERLFILSPLRALLQRHWEARQLLAMGGPLTGAHVLETGCGPGFGIDLLYRRFKAARVDAFDLDPKMIALVRQRQRNPAVAGPGCGWATSGTFRWPTRPTTRLSTSGRSTTWSAGARQSAKFIGS
jgi:hypothetical protein